MNLGTAGKICNVTRGGALCGLDFYLTTISNYGVIGAWKFRVGPIAAEYWLYKPSTGGGGGGGGSDFAKGHPVQRSIPASRLPAPAR